MQIDARKMNLTRETRHALLPLADRVLVGTDDIEARWWVHEDQPKCLYIGATGDHHAILTTHHRGEPCAGCAHNEPLRLAKGEFVSTISFVSYWAGLLQACALAEFADRPGCS